MNNDQIVRRLRFFLLGMSAFMMAGTLVELSLINHWGSGTQIIPFVLVVTALATLAWVVIRPQRLGIQILRLVMAVTALGSAFGVFEHIEHNLAFELEIRPGVAAADVFFEALSGANPLLAPGILGMAAVIALAATYYHPTMQQHAAV